jgi:hypothetical protein
LPKGVLQKENRAGILLGTMPERGMEKASKEAPQGLPHGEALLMALFLQQIQEPAKHPIPLILECWFERTLRRSRTSPIRGTKGRVWLASNREGSKIIGDERLWRVNLEELLRKQERRPKTTPWTPTIEALRRPIIVVGRNNSVRGIDDALGVIKGFRVRICIEAEKELQIFGCGWRIVTCQFRGKNVVLHHNGNTATMKWKAFKQLVAAMRAMRPKRPWLRLVVSNPRPLIARAEAA